MTTIRLTVAQATVRFLSRQFSVRDDDEQRLVAGVLGIFGHGNVAGIGEALLESELRDPSELPYLVVRNEQGGVNAAVGYAKHRLGRATLAVTTSVGPGATNLLTGAALATTNRIPVLLLPADVFATRGPDPVLQQLEAPHGVGLSVNEAFRAVSTFFDRVERPEQLPAALLGAMRALTDPAQAGAVVVALPEDVQAEAYDWPEELFRRRVWRIARPPVEPAVLSDAAALIADSRRPVVIAGGGVRYSEAGDALSAFAARHGFPVGQTHAGKGALTTGHALDVGGIGATGTSAANALAERADLVIGIGTRYSDFTTASMSLFTEPGVRFLNINITPFDAPKLGALAVVADARTAIEQLDAALGEHVTSSEYRAEIAARSADWQRIRQAAVSRDWAAESADGLPSQLELIGVLNDELGPRDVIVQAAGSAPGDLHRLWEPASPRQYHVEYAYSTMGYEIAGALGVRIAEDDTATAGSAAQVVALVGDGSYLMLCHELVTAIAEQRKLVVVLVDNRGYASIGRLSESVGSQRFGTSYRFRDPATGRLDGAGLPVDFPANLRSLGAEVHEARTTAEFRAAVRAALDASVTTAVYVRADPLAPAAPGGAWWDVPVAEVSSLESTVEARHRYERESRHRRWLG